MRLPCMDSACPWLETLGSSQSLHDTCLLSIAQAMISWTMRYAYTSSKDIDSFQQGLETALATHIGSNPAHIGFLTAMLKQRIYSFVRSCSFIML